MPTGRQNNFAPAVESSRRAEFESLYERYSREVWAIAYGRWTDADMALDIMQEAFLRLWRQWGTGGEIQNPRAWLLRVARNLAEDHAKSSFRRNGTQPPEVLNGLRSGQPLATDEMEKHEQHAQLRAELDEMSPDDRQLLTLRYALDYDATTIAEMLSINVTAVHMRLSRARQRLAERLSTHRDFNPGDPAGTRN